MVPTIIISTVLVAIVGWVIYRLIRDARSGAGLRGRCGHLCRGKNPSKKIRLRMP